MTSQSRRQTPFKLALIEDLRNNKIKLSKGGERKKGRQTDTDYRTGSHMTDRDKKANKMKEYLVQFSAVRTKNQHQCKK